MKWKETEQFRATLQCIKELIGLYRSTIGDFGISENEFWIWYTLIAMTGSYAQQDVCDMWSLSKQTVNTIIARMVQKGLVHLEAMPGAKNRKCIHLTNTGERYGQRIVGPVLDAEQRAIARLDAGESLACTTMLKRYIQVLKEELRGMKCREQKRGNGGMTISEIF